MADFALVIPRLRRQVAAPLWWLCAALDRVPAREDGRWLRFGGWGCYPLRLSRVASYVEGAA